METVLIAIAALIASLFTFFSGFGLGTLMLPVFCVFYPINVAILLTALVHFFNNGFKFILVYRNIQKAFALRFAFFAIPAAVLGTYIFNEWLENEILIGYYLFNFFFPFLVPKQELHLPDCPSSALLLMY